MSAGKTGSSSFYSVKQYPLQKFSPGLANTLIPLETISIKKNNKINKKKKKFLKNYSNSLGKSFHAFGHNPNDPFNGQLKLP